ncbi:MAG: hypothetical protein ACM3XR_06410 [Bacillota bacterium]
MKRIPVFIVIAAIILFSPAGLVKVTGAAGAAGTVGAVEAAGTVVAARAGSPVGEAGSAGADGKAGAAGTASAAGTVGVVGAALSADENASYSLTDENTGIHAEINWETLDEEAYEFLRDYYNNRTLSDDKLFERYVELKKSYIIALENRYNTNYLRSEETSSETAMVIYHSGNERLFGIESYVYLYNIAVFKAEKHIEQTYLDIIVPVRSSHSILTVGISIPRELLGAEAFHAVSAILQGIRHDGLAPQYAAPIVLNNRDVIDKAKLGIYPAAYQEQPNYVDAINEAAGYALMLPDTYVPFIQNNLGGQFTYTSYKINPNSLFSISSEPLRDSGLENAMSSFKVTSLSSIKVIESGSRYYGNNEYNFIYYTNTVGGVKKFFYTYFITSNSRLYRLQFEYNHSEPGDNLLMQMKKILISFRITGEAVSYRNYAEIEGISTSKYLNREEGYSFIYPENWRVEEVSRNIAYDRLNLVVPGLSGVLEITFQESDLKSMVSFSDLARGVEGNPVSSWPDLTIDYDPPFAGKTSRLLFTGLSIDGPVSTIYRLSVFTDDSGKNKLCYSVDIIRGRKIYSMFITTGEYHAKDGSFLDKKTNDLINMVASSFGHENTPESRKRMLEGESRNRKIVLAEKYLKHLIDPHLKITSVGKLHPDGSTTVTVDNSADSGYYRIMLDYPARHVEVLDRVLKREILETETNRLREKFKGVRITGIIRNEPNMTILIECEDDITRTRISRVYQVKVSGDRGNFSWNTRRIAGIEDYMQECNLFIKSILSPDAEVYIYGGNTFPGIDIYAHKGLKYPVFTYCRSREKDLEGFMALLMDPVTNSFSLAKGFVLLDYCIDKIEKQYGIKASKTAGSMQFDPETFTLRLPVEDGAGKFTGTECFKIFYNPEKRIVEYERINSAKQGKH